MPDEITLAAGQVWQPRPDADDPRKITGCKQLVAHESPIGWLWSYMDGRYHADHMSYPRDFRAWIKRTGATLEGS